MKYSEIFTTTDGRKVLGKGIIATLGVFGIVLGFIVLMGSLQKASGQDLVDCEHRSALECANDVGQEVKYLFHQIGGVFRELGEASKTTARSAETTQASFGGQSVCISPGLNLGENFSMTFEIPGRKLSVEGQKGQKRVVELENFETKNVRFKVDRFASLMNASILVKVWRNGQGYKLIKKPIKEYYSKQRLEDSSCVPYFVQSRDREKDLQLHNSN